MDISSISSMLGMQKDLMTSQTQATGDDFKNILNQAIENQDDKELREACNTLESYMLSMVFKQMKESMLQDDENSLIPKGDYIGAFEETMINSMADQMVEAGGIGLSDQLYRQIKNTYAAQMDISNQNQAAVASSNIKIDNEA